MRGADIATNTTARAIAATAAMVNGRGGLSDRGIAMTVFVSCATWVDPSSMCAWFGESSAAACDEDEMMCTPSP